VIITLSLQYNDAAADDDDNDADVDVKAQGLSQVSAGKNVTLTRALSAESLLSQTTVASPKLFRG